LVSRATPLAECPDHAAPTLQYDKSVNVDANGVDVWRYAVPGIP
jgi:hypothetical protein